MRWPDGRGVGRGRRRALDGDRVVLAGAGDADRAGLARALRVAGAGGGRAAVAGDGAQVDDVARLEAEGAEVDGGAEVGGGGPAQRPRAEPAAAEGEVLAFARADDVLECRVGEAEVVGGAGAERDGAGRGADDGVARGEGEDDAGREVGLWLQHDEAVARGAAESEERGRRGHGERDAPPAAGRAHRHGPAGGGARRAGPGAARVGECGAHQPGVAGALEHERAPTSAATPVGSSRVRAGRRA
jgi:hypothetical protein